MSKLSDAGAQHQSRRPSARGLSPFDRIPMGSDDRHPVDVAVEHRIGDRVRRKWIVKLQSRLVTLLGQHSGVFLKLETIMNEQSRDRERCYFNVGYEHGSAEAFARSRRRLQSHGRAEELVTEFLQRSFREELPKHEVTAALLGCALSLVASSGPR